MRRSWYSYAFADYQKDLFMSHTIPTYYQQFIHTSRYARWREYDGRRETWEETVDRYINYMCDQQLTGKIDDATRAELREAILKMEVMPSMRCLMTAGKALERSNEAGFNCSSVAIDSPIAFSEMMYLLMCGVGVGFSVERQFINDLPTVPALKKSRTVIKVDDSRRGWASAYQELVGMLYSGRIPDWDTSDVRPAGAPLRTFGGRASGPAPLESLFRFTVSTFKAAEGRRLNSLECHDICCKIGEIVVSGGVRRSAEISLSNPSDDRMRYAKSGNWYETAPWRRMANNSACYTERPSMDIFIREWLALYESKSGERGIFNRYAAKNHVKSLGTRDPEHDFLVNPCVTADMVISTDKGDMTVKDLIGVPFKAEVHGKFYECKTGFFKTGTRWVYKVSTVDGQFVRATGRHEIFVVRDDEEIDVAVRDLKSGDLLILNSMSDGMSADTSELGAVVPDGVEDVYDCTVEDIHHYSANGIIVHNCGEIILRSGQMCNLSEVVVRHDDTVETLTRKTRLATILGTMQSTLTNFSYLRPHWRANTEEEALLGVSLTGVMDHPVLSGSQGKTQLGTMLASLREVTREVNDEWSKKLGVNPSAAITTIKPSGCRPWYALTTTDRGLLTLEELLRDHPHGEEWGTPGEPVKALQGDSSVNITKTFDNGLAPVVRIVLDNGMYLDSTRDHKWWVTCEIVDGVIVPVNAWIRADDIGENDIIKLDTCVYQSTAPAALKSIDMDDGSDMIQPTEMTDDLAWLFGYLSNAIYDNDLDKYRIGLLDRRKFNLAKVRNILLDYFGIVSHISTGAIFTLSVRSKSLCKWLEANMIIRRCSFVSSHTMPEVVRRSSRDHIVAFIAGYLDSRVKYETTALGKLRIISPVRDEFSAHIQHVGYAVGLIFARSLFDVPRPSGTTTRAVELTLGHSTNSESFRKLCSNSVVLRQAQPDGYEEDGWECVFSNANSVTLGVSRVESVGVMSTFDIETENHWYYAGAVKSHNTVSQLVDCASGLHPRYSRHYIRTVRGANHDPITKLLKDEGVPHEPDVTSPDTTTVFSFPIESPSGAVLRDNLDAIQQLEIWKVYKTKWCDHNPSITVYVNEDQWMTVGAWVYKNFDILGGVSFLPSSDHSYAQAPYQEISEDKYRALSESMPKGIDWSKLYKYESDDSSINVREYACNGDSCEVVDIGGA